MERLRHPSPVGFWQAIHAMFKNEDFTDMVFVCPGEGLEQTIFVKCHSLVVGSLSPMLKTAVLASSNPAEPTSVILKEVTGSQVQAALEAIYRYSFAKPVYKVYIKNPHLDFARFSAF